MWPLRATLRCLVCLLVFLVLALATKSHSWLLVARFLRCFALRCLLRNAPKFGTHNPLRGCVYLTKGLPWSLFGQLDGNCTSKWEIIPEDLEICFVKLLARFDEIRFNFIKSNDIGPKDMDYIFGSIRWLALGLLCVVSAVGP
jgi:hypothetical protein